MDRITRVRIKNVRAIESVDLELGRPVTVLIGENGSGKSTILECLELLRKAAESSFLQQFYNLHRGMPGLLRKGATELSVGARIESDDPDVEPLDYEFTLRVAGPGALVVGEVLRNARDGFRIITNTGEGPRVYDAKTNSAPKLDPQPEGLALTSFGAVPPDPRIGRVVRALRGIEVHLPFDTLAAWAAQSVQRTPTLRGTGMLVPADRLTLLGHNLASAWSALKNVDDAHWRHTMGLVRLGLGESVDSINTVPDAGGGYVGLALKRADLAEPIPAANLSDGQLAWLAFVALARLNPGRSLLAVDEPELHLHPSLLGRVVTMLASLPGGAPVVLSTHSDRVLELLDDPADAVRVCSLIGSRAEVSRIDAEELPRWLEQFGDLGQLRAAGYLSRVLVPTPPVASHDEGGE